MPNIIRRVNIIKKNGTDKPTIIKCMLPSITRRVGDNISADLSINSLYNILDEETYSKLEELGINDDNTNNENNKIFLHWAYVTNEVSAYLPFILPTFTSNDNPNTLYNLKKSDLKMPNRNVTATLVYVDNYFVNCNEYIKYLDDYANWELSSKEYELTKLTKKK